MKNRILAAICAGVILIIFVIASIAIISGYNKRKEVLFLKQALEEKTAQLNQKDKEITELNLSKISLSRNKTDLESKIAIFKFELDNLRQKETVLSQQLKALFDERNNLENTLKSDMQEMQKKFVLEKRYVEEETARMYSQYALEKENLSSRINGLEYDLKITVDEIYALEENNSNTLAMLEKERSKLHKYRQALIYESENMHKEAVEKYEEILSLDSYEAAAHMKLARIYENYLKDLEKARYHKGVYDALQEPSGDEEKVPLQDNVVSENKERKPSITAPKQIEVESIPDEAELARLRQEEFRNYYNLALQYDSEGRYEESLVEYHKALELMPNDADLHYNLGILYDDHIKDSKKAVFHYQRYLYLNPSAEDAKEVTTWINRIKDDLKWQRKLG
jgi:tetratricopeptide (TPR) repeat protein